MSANGSAFRYDLRLDWNTHLEGVGRVWMSVFITELWTLTNCIRVRVSPSVQIIAVVDTAAPIFAVAACCHTLVACNTSVSNVTHES